jgi:hypothetical protein
MRRIAVLLAATAMLAGCGGTATNDAIHGRLVVTVLAGPTCPVEQVDNPCDPRRPPVASLTVERPSGELVAMMVARNGRSALGGLDAGSYRLITQPVAGLMGTPEPVAFSIMAGGVTRLQVTYDTGIR